MSRMFEGTWPIRRYPREQKFCPYCGVTMDLHPSDDGDDWACEVAQHKADLLDAFDRMVGEP